MAAMGPPNKQAILSLYNKMLRSSQSFSSYNFREYFESKTKQTFKEMQSETDPGRLTNMYANATKESEVLHRSAIINQLYAGRKLAVEVEEQPERVMDRGNN